MRTSSIRTQKPYRPWTPRQELVVLAMAAIWAETSAPTKKEVTRIIYEIADERGGAIWRYVSNASDVAFNRLVRDIQATVTA